MRTKTEKLLAFMNVLAWITFIGLMIKAGAILISYGVSVVNPEGAKNLYKGTNLYTLRQFSFWHYTSNVSFLIAVLVSEAFIAFLVIKVLSKIKMATGVRSEFDFRRIHIPGWSRICYRTDI